MIRYMRVEWLHSSDNSPVILYSVMVDDWEARKIDVYRDGHVDFASESIETGQTGLGLAPVPPVEEIAESPEFRPAAISASEFEEDWNRVTEGRIS